MFHVTNSKEAMMKAIDKYSSDPEAWQRGMCGTYACALQELHPELRFGIAGESFDDGEGFHPHHFFAHDNNHYYDSLGKHPLASLPYDVVQLDQNPADWGIPQDEAGSEGIGANLQAAREHAARQGFAIPGSH